MRTSLIAVFLIICASCTETKVSTSQKKEASFNRYITKPNFQKIIDTSDVIGSILIYDLNDDLYYSNDFEWSNIGQLPASTFKIANTIIGLETGVIESDSTIFKWDGTQKWSKNWEQDLMLKDAFQFSCVPCYQEVAKNIGSKRMNDYISKFRYGSLRIDSSNIADFWLEGTSRITQKQQISFLKRLYRSELPISKRTEQIVKSIMLVEETDLYKLSAKSGLSIVNDKYNGWYVGYLELKNKTYLFATNIEPKKDFVFDSFVNKRSDLSLSAFKEMNLLK